MPADQIPATTADAALDSTTALLERARNGDDAAFAALVAPHRDALTAHCYRMLGTLAEAEDVVQDSLLRAWRGLDRLRDDTSLRAWLYQIATNRCLTRLGQRRERRELPLGEGDAGQATEPQWLGPYPDHRLGLATLDPAQQAIARESITLAFVAALQWLPPRQRAVLLLREVIGFSAATTADLLRTSPPAVNSQLQRARAQVAKSRAQPDGGESVSWATASAAQRQTAERYARAWEAGAIDEIVAQLTDDARYAMPPLPAAFTGPAAIRGFLGAGPLAEAWRFRLAAANNTLAFGTYRWDQPAAAWLPGGLDLLQFRGDQITGVVSFLDADFSAFDLPSTLPAPGPAASHSA